MMAIGKRGFFSGLFACVAAVPAVAMAAPKRPMMTVNKMTAFRRTLSQYCYWRTTQTELIPLVPKEPFTVDAAQIESYADAETWWKPLVAELKEVDRRPVFERLDPLTGHVMAVYANGRSEGFPDSHPITLNRIPIRTHTMEWHYRRRIEALEAEIATLRGKT